MQPLVSKRSVFVACVLAIGSGVAAAPSGADSGDDAAAADDAATAAAADEAGDGLADVSLPLDSEGVGFVQDDGAVPPSLGRDVFQLLCIANPNVTSFNFASVKAPYADAAGCKAFNPQGGYPNSRTCACTRCFAIMQQCDSLPGCLAIEQCLLKSQCQDANTCYNNNGAPCTSVYNQYGAGGTASNLTALLAACSKMNNCPMAN